jgi:hypothetical protein
VKRPVGPSDPYTSSVETWRNRFTPNSRAASRSTCVPRTFVSMNTEGARMERSTWLSAARCITASIFSLRNTSAMSSPLQMSPRTNR